LIRVRSQKSELMRIPSVARSSTPAQVRPRLPRGSKSAIRCVPRECRSVQSAWSDDTPIVAVEELVPPPQIGHAIVQKTFIRAASYTRCEPRRSVIRRSDRESNGAVSITVVVIFMNRLTHHPARPGVCLSGAGLVFSCLHEGRQNAGHLYSTTCAPEIAFIVNLAEP